MCKRNVRVNTYTCTQKVWSNYAIYDNKYYSKSNGFFFNFRPGHTLHVSLKIKEDEHRVGGFPDARFIASSSQKTIAVTEVI